MKLDKRVFLLLNFLGFSSMAQDMSSTLTSPFLAIKPSQFFEKVQTDLDLSLKYGNTSNAAQDRGAKVEAQYLSLNPSLLAYTSLKRFWLQGLISYQGKEFTDNFIADNLNTGELQYGLGLGTFLNEKWEVGGEISQQKRRAREVDALTASSFGRPSKSTLSSAGLYARFNTNRQSGFELGGGRTLKRAKTTSIDEEGNQYRDDYNETYLYAEASYTLPQDLKVLMNYDFSQRQYQERRARFTEGTIDNQFRTPFLKEFKQSLGLGLEKKLFDFVIEFGPQLTFNKDQIFAAQDYQELGYTSKLSLPVPQLLDLTLAYSWSKKQYQNFIGDVIENPTSNNLRRDFTRSFQAGLDFKLKTVSPTLSYSLINNDSNYPLEGFSEEVLEGGLRVAF